MFAIHSMVVILCDLYFACVISCVVRSRAADKLRRFCDSYVCEAGSSAGAQVAADADGEIGLHPEGRDPTQWR